MVYHTVEQGEFLARIARDYGFSDYRVIWEHSENAELRERRNDNPNVLFPGDRLFIPDREQRTETGATDQTHRFVLHGPRLLLRVKVRDFDGQPVTDTPCDLFLGLDRFRLTTDGEGIVEQEITADADDGKLLVPDRDLEFDLRIGHLDPIAETPGGRARLNNLGYFAGYDDDDTEHLTRAIEEFQCDEGIRPQTGEYDQSTQDRLRDVHGT